MLKAKHMEQPDSQELHLSTADMVSLATPLLPPSLAHAFNIPLQNKSTSTGDGSGSTNPSITPGPFSLPAFAQAPYYHPAAYGAMMPQAFYDPSMYFAGHFAGFPMAGMLQSYDYTPRPPAEDAEPQPQAKPSAPEDDDTQGRALKRQRLVWTDDLHKRFVKAVKDIGDGKAVPKAIMKKMNVEGLTRENVASHLQKYRLQQRRGNTDDEGSCEQAEEPEAKAAEPALRGAQRRKRKAIRSPLARNEGLGSTSRPPETDCCSDDTAGSASGGP